MLEIEGIAYWFSIQRADIENLWLIYGFISEEYKSLSFMNLFNKICWQFVWFLII